jgi:hypothetical protein
MSVAPPPVMPEPQSPSSDNDFSRLIGAIFTPRETFASIVRRPTWILPLIILALLVATTIFIFGQRVGWRDFMIRQDQENSRTQKQMENMTQEQRDNMLDTQTKVAPIFGYVFGTVGIVVAALIVAGLLLLGFMIIAGVRPSYKQALGIVSYAWTPGIIGALLGLLILFLKDPSTVDLNKLVASNVGALMPDGTAKWLTTLLSSIDVFAFWNIVLMAFGFSAVDPKRLSVGKAFGIIFALFLFWTLIKTGMTAAFS